MFVKSIVLDKIGVSLLLYTVAITVTAFFLSFLDFTHFNGFEIERVEKHSLLQRYFDRLYFCSTTFSTVGYGDITPKSNIAKFLTILLQFISTIGIISIIVF